MPETFVTLNNAGGAIVIDEYDPLAVLPNVPTNYPTDLGPSSPICPECGMICSGCPGGGGGGTATPMTAAERMAIVPKPGQLIWDTTLQILYVGDGETQGGIMVEGGGSGGDFTSVAFWMNANQ